jgi:hypothetical protein
VIPVAIDAITYQHVEDLRTNGVREGRTIEYKQSLPGGTDKDKKEFLADVSSFANAAGGDLIYGVAAKDGVPTAIPGLDPFNPDQDVLGLESSIRNAIEPRILALQTQVVSDDQGTHVLVIRVPRSWSGPHMVTYKGSSRFFTRSSAGKSQMDLNELRSAFALAGDLPERIRNWRDERVGRVMAHETPVPLTDTPTMILHLVPLDSFENPYRIEASTLDTSNCNEGFAPLGPSNCQSRLNIDGYVTYRSKPNSDSHESYCQVYRSGRVESVCSQLWFEQGENGIAGIFLEKFTMEATARYLSTLANLDVHPPMVIMLTFVRAKGLYLVTGSERDHSYETSDRDVLLIPDVLINETPRHLPRAMRPMFDAVWNAWGYPESRNYDENGDWKKQPLMSVPQES